MAERPVDIVDLILLSGRAGARFLGEGGVLRPVWKAFALGQLTADLLLIPMDDTSSAKVARALADTIRETADRAVSDIFPLEGAVAVRVTRKGFLHFILPLTGVDLPAELESLRQLISSRAQPPRRVRYTGHWPLPFVGVEEDAAPEWGEARIVTMRHVIDLAVLGEGRLTPDQRLAALALWIYALREEEFPTYTSEPLSQLADQPLEPERFRSPVASNDTMIWRVSLNRAVQRMMMSVDTIKADAARRLFELDCREITWAVADSGIDGSHPAFRDHEAGGFASRIDHAYDFTKLRRYAAYDALAGGNDVASEVAAALHLQPAEAEALLAQLRDDAEQGRPYDWESLSKLIEIPPDTLPPEIDGKVEPHGTHVAGVLGGDWREGETSVFRGVCPNIRLYDLRILSDSSESTEVAVLAALEFVRWINRRNRYITVHGVNLSIGLEHDLENYACGQTPVCQACNETVSSGIVVVAAAGNWGIRRYGSIDGDFRGYAAISIADPGNAEKVITVGATHRERPHEYGVSFFSSRGPTGDGRAKPDLVAPGERIDGPLPNLGLGRLDGTSMAAPHVSGVAAMLLARFPEMIGRPERVKAAIIATATDLGREKTFQGAGLVDALRALQSL